MQYESQNVVFGTAFLNTIMTALKTAPTNPLIMTAKVRLSVDPTFNPNPGSSIASLAANEANYSGYTAGGVAAVLSAPVNLSPTCQGVLIPALFEATTATPFVPNNVSGYWLDDGTNMILGERFAGGASAGFGAPGDFLQLIVQIPAQAGQATA